MSEHTHAAWFGLLNHAAKATFGPPRQLKTKQVIRAAYPWTRTHKQEEMMSARNVHGKFATRPWNCRSAVMNICKLPINSLVTNFEMGCG